MSSSRARPSSSAGPVKATSSLASLVNEYKESSSHKLKRPEASHGHGHQSPAPAASSSRIKQSPSSVSSSKARRQLDLSVSSSINTKPSSHQQLTQASIQKQHAAVDNLSQQFEVFLKKRAKERERHILMSSSEEEDDEDDEEEKQEHYAELRRQKEEEEQEQERRKRRSSSASSSSSSRHYQPVEDQAHERRTQRRNRRDSSADDLNASSRSMQSPIREKDRMQQMQFEAELEQLERERRHSSSRGSAKAKPGGLVDDSMISLSPTIESRAVSTCMEEITFLLDRILIKDSHQQSQSNGIILRLIRESVQKAIDRAAHELRSDLEQKSKTVEANASHHKHLEEQVDSLRQQVSHDAVSSRRLSDTVSMLQDAHSALVRSNEALLKELSNIKARHLEEQARMAANYESLRRHLQQIHDWKSAASASSLPSE